MSEDDRSRTPPRKRTSYNRRSGMAALMGELAEPLPPMDDFAAEPPSSQPPPAVPPPIVASPIVSAPTPPPAPSDEDLLLRGEDYGKWAEPEAPKRSIDTMIGKIVDGRYEIRGMVGRGGMGAVFEAYQDSVQRTVALKVLLREFCENETVIRRFHKEALAVSRLTHPNTISVYDFGQTDDGVLYIAMEYLRGEDVASVLRRGGALSVRRALHIMRQVCKSLSEAHKVGVIHRDLKPDNIFLNEIEGERDFVKVLDFGVAKLRERDGGEHTLTQAGTMFGTPKYMSPEQTRSTDLDARSDIYSLGVILYEMLMGEPPFVSDNPLSILIAHVNEQPASFADRRPDLSIHPAVEAVVFQALAKDRDDRPGDVDVLLDQLEALIALEDGAAFAEVQHRLPDPGAFGLGAEPEPEPEPELLGPVLADVAIADVTLDEHPTEDRRRGSGLPLLLLLLIPAIGAGVYFITRGGEPAPTDRVAVTDGAKGIAAEPPKPVIEPPEPAEPLPVEPESTHREFVVGIKPDRAVIYDTERDEKVGQGPQAILKIDAPTTFEARAKGYKTLSFELSPSSDKRTLDFTLEALPPPKPKPAPKPKPTVVIQRPDPVERPVVPTDPVQPPPVAKPIVAPEPDMELEHL